MTAIESSSVAARPARPIALLLAEAGEADRHIHSRAALRAGFRVQTAADGHEALAKALVTLPDVVVTEANLPGMSELELVRRIRRNPRTQAMPVVVWAERPISDLIEVARAFECTWLVSKACAFGTLARTIRRVVRDRPRGVAKS